MKGLEHGFVRIEMLCGWYGKVGWWGNYVEKSEIWLNVYIIHMYTLEQSIHLYTLAILLAA